MTIAAIWFEDNALWAVADTRVSTPGASGGVNIRTDSGVKLFPIQVSCRSMAGHPYHFIPSHRMTYGFAFAGDVLPALMTIATANTLLSDLVGPDASSIPSMADVAEVVRKLAQRFSKEALIGSASRYGRFEAALFGYCTSRREFLTYILGDIEDGSQGFSLQELKVLSEGGIIASIGATDAKSKLDEVIGKFRLHGEPHGRTGRWPRLAVEAMVEERPILSVGGAISIGIAMQDGFRAYYNSRPLVVGQPPAWRSFNGIDVDEEIGLVGPCTVGMLGMA